jgi:hypothetical protein
MAAAAAPRLQFGEHTWLLFASWQLAGTTTTNFAQ